MSDERALSVESRKRVFFSALGRTGDARASAVEASPGSSEAAARKYFYRLRKSDPSFAREWEEALADFVLDLEAEAARRALEGAVERKETVTSGGQRYLTTTQKASDAMLLRLLARYAPDRWGVQRVDVAVKPGTWMFPEIRKMDPRDAARLAEGLERVDELRGTDPVAAERLLDEIRRPEGAQ